ncbi:hypothetical protein BYT27DRAFT_7141559 [Phlegmacium glaucopus]|nr:hypothetical protein BYT27DRAFT_7141559 [Phlegmacium glaucopus]
MSGLTVLEATFIGTVLEGLTYGLYCVMFVLYIQVHTRKKRVDRDLLIYPLSTLFILCTAFFALDFVEEFLTIMRGQRRQFLVWRLNIITSAIYSFIDFIAQGVLMYRCWVVWNRQVLIIVVPFILSIISLATSLTLVGELVILGKTQQFNDPPAWFTPIGILSFSLSLAVNAIFTGLLVFKIVKTSLAFRRSGARNPGGKNDYLPLISILIESGVVLFVVELLWVVLFSLNSNEFYLFGGPIAITYGIIPTMIVVRVGMGNANNQTSSLEGNLQFTSADANSPTKLSGNTFEWSDSHTSRTLCSQDSKERLTK